MSNSSLFVSLFSKWPKTRRSRIYLWRIMGLLLGLVIGVTILIHLNEIPTKTINLVIDGYGMKTADLDLTLLLGRNTDLRERFDSTYKNVFKNSNRDGVTVDADAFNIAGSYLLFNEVVEGKSLLQKCFPQESSAALDSMNAMLRVHMVTTDVNQRLRMFNVVKDLNTKAKKILYNENGDENDCCYSLITSKTSRETNKRIESVVTDKNVYFFFRDSLFVTGTGKSEGIHNSFLYNRSIWQTSDISQTYVGIHLSSDLHQMFHSEVKDGLRGLSDYRRDSLNTTLSIDFGSPVTLSAMEPAPDSVSMTGLSFSAPEKVDKIIKDGLIFHVTFDQNKNLQAVKIFWITTIIAALVGILLNQSFKWTHYKIQKRRLEKRKKDRSEQKDEHSPKSHDEPS